MVGCRGGLVGCGLYYQLLLNRSVDVNAKEYKGYGSTSLHTSAEDNASEATVTAEVLLKKGGAANKNNDGWTSLHTAVRRDVSTTVEVLSHYSGRK